ncbi:MAG: glucosaminidase domain-containing protein [Alistipes sp.]|nr:glucosaminidase domain-containing protein [Alistipes sp.]
MIFSRKAIFVLLFAFSISIMGEASAQTRQTKEEYIDRYKTIAIDHMERYGIPASITMAQGILESDSGNSNLARRSNNHFGIKCKKDWKGAKVYHTDDAPNECFRSYETVEESYEDHAKFLDNSPRYDSLFAYQATDYRSWARGLKAAGYATAPDYAQRLIKIIEDNKLYLLDEENGAMLYASRFKSNENVAETFAESSSVNIPTATEGRIDPNDYRVVERTYNGYAVYANNRTHFVIARNGDKFADIASTFAITERTLRKYNEISPASTADPIEGEMIYIERKQTEWNGDEQYHIVREGETLLSLSQEYGVRLKQLAAMNKLKVADTLQAGQRIKLYR